MFKLFYFKFTPILLYSQSNSNHCQTLIYDYTNKKRIGDWIRA